MLSSSFETDGSHDGEEEREKKDLLVSDHEVMVTREVDVRFAVHSGDGVQQC